MQFLDDFQKEEGGRDICQFVEFQRHQSNKIQLTKATLEEIPDQVVSYFQGQGIEPLPAIDGSQLQIVPNEYNEDDEIEVSLDFGENEEITLVSGGFKDDTGYGTYNTVTGKNSKGNKFP